MATLSIIAANCGRGTGEENSILEHGSKFSFKNDFFANSTVRSLSRSVNGVWFGYVEGIRVRSGKKFRIAAKIKKGKKRDYPWPDDIDPDSEKALTYLSYFKPLDEKPKPVALAFEKPLVDLEKKIIEVNCFLMLPILQ